ncbi:MAG: phycobilisome linker polypeptide [Cyanobacteria bacterium P01_G01_bin.54]
MATLIASNLKVAGQLGLDSLDGTYAELCTNATESEVQNLIRVVYRQVFGNDHILQSERFVSAESQLRQGNLSVKDFIATLAKSELYKEKFFYCNNNQRFVELNFKHLLGRPPHDQQELAYHTQLCEEQGFYAEIDSYLESEEYERKFGSNIVPYFTGFSVDEDAQTTNFTRMFNLYRGYASSDRGQVGGQNARLNRQLAVSQVSSITTPTGRGESKTLPQKAFGGVGNQAARMYRIEATKIMGASLRPVIRRSNTAYLVPYEQLSEKVQQVVRSGGKIVSVRPA